MPDDWKKPSPEDQEAGREAVLESRRCEAWTVDPAVPSPRDRVPCPRSRGRQRGSGTTKGEELICPQILIKKNKIG
jgi:hypothetical protein